MIEQAFRSVFIPPLNLTPKADASVLLGRLFSQKSEDKKLKSPVEALRENSEFIKQKSLYRYYISKNKLPEPQEKRSLNPNSPNKVVNFDDTKQKLARILSTKDIRCHESQLQKTKQTELNKQKYFKRKNRLSRTQLCTINPKVQQNTMDNQEEASQKSLIDLLNNEFETKGLKYSSSMNFQAVSQKQAEIASLKTQNEIISRLNSQLKRKLLEKQEVIHQLSSNIQRLQREKRQMQKQMDKISDKVKFSDLESALLISQLQLKEKTIRQLEYGYRYMEIESTVLNHTKSQCSQQMNMIEHLERQKKVLEEKVRLLYEVNKKKKNLRSSSKLSENSDISLSLSIEKQDNDQLNDPSTVQHTSKSSKYPLIQSTEKLAVCDKNK